MNGFFKDAFVNLAMVVIGMAGFWLVEARHFVTRDEASAIVEERSPYIKERAIIFKSIEDSKEIQGELKKTLDENTKAVNELNTQMAVLNATLEVMTKQQKLTDLFVGRPE